jgi:hypothetical protein
MRNSVYASPGYGCINQVYVRICYVIGMVGVQIKALENKFFNRCV